MDWKYESIDPGSLASALKECLGGVDHGTTDHLASGISDASWQSTSKGKLTKLLRTMGGDAYKSLESTIQSYIGVASLIGQYKDLEEEYKALDAEYASLEPKLWIEKKRDVIWYDQWHVGHKGTETYRVKDPEVERRMNEIKERQKDIITEAKNLEKQIDSSV